MEIHKNKSWNSVRSDRKSGKSQNSARNSRAVLGTVI
jgi:hypothetical protein